MAVVRVAVNDCVDGVRGKWGGRNCMPNIWRGVSTRIKNYLAEKTTYSENLLRDGLQCRM